MKLRANSFLIRVYAAHIVFLISAGVISGRLFELQIKEYQTYLARAESQHAYSREIEPERGEIVLADRDSALKPAAVTKFFPYVYAVPKEVQNPQETSKMLSSALSVAESLILSRLSKPGDPYELIAKNVSDEAAAEIEKVRATGVYIGKNRFRYYPSGELAAHVIGFVSKDDNDRMEGKYGVEAYYDKILRGRPGLSQNLRDGSGNTFLQFQRSLPQNGASLILSIDQNVQFKTEEVLAKTVKKWNAKGGSAIVLESKSGAVLAMATYPAFDKNNFSKEKNLGIFLNHAVSSRFEPGSVFKAVTMAAALESGAISPDTVYSDTGEIHIGGYTIRNSDLKAHGRTTMLKVLEQSYNTGAVFAAERMGHEIFREFLARSARLDEKTGIDLPAEAIGDISGLFPPDGRSINFATASFGQGIAITPIKLAQVFGVFANGGNLMQPRVVSAIRYPGGKIEAAAPKVLASSVLSAETISKLTFMLVEVIENGTGKRAKIKGYTLAGKTGTAQVPNPSGRGYIDEFIHTFAVYAPAVDPPLVVLMKVDQPVGVRYAEGTVVPATRELFEWLFQYYAIPPDRPEELQ